MRFCAKTTCSREAASSCGFDYSARRVWLAPLGRERDPSAYDLCEEHAETLRVPRGWELEDHRSRPMAEDDPFAELLPDGSGALPALPGRLEEEPADGGLSREPRLVPQLGATFP